jgi:hypothetical protein
MSAKEKIARLVDKFEHETNRNQSEADVRADYIDLLFEALGWNVHNNPGESTNYRREGYIRGVGIVDVGLEIAGHPVLIIEAKKFGVLPRPNERLGDRTLEEKQLFRYARGKKIPYCILTNFERLQVFNADHERLILSFDDPAELVGRLPELSHLSPEKVRAGSLPSTERQLEIKPIDQEFLASLQDWRLCLANAIYTHNKDNHSLKTGEGFDFRKLTEAVQRLLDRLILIRYSDDKEVLLAYDVIDNILSDYHKRGVYASSNYLMRQLIDFSHMMDDHHNTTLFQPGHICEQVTIPNDVLEKVMNEINNISFRKFTSDILGNTYETYLSTKLLLKNGVIISEEHTDIRKAGGIYYTPSFIVHYIVDNTLGYKLKELEKEYGFEAINKVCDIKVLDPACGSGSFLIYAYHVLADYYRRTNEIIEDERKKLLADFTKVDMFKRMEMFKQLPEPLVDYPHHILERQLYGVDKDPEAAEIAAVNLTMQALSDMKREKLPLILNENIKVGNSLISSVDKELYNAPDEALKLGKPFDWTVEFKNIIDDGGFDVIIGNPPYLGEKGNKDIFQVLSRSSLGKRFYLRRMDIFYFFFHLAIDLGTPNSQIGFITTDYYPNDDGAKKLRCDLKSRTFIRILIDFNELRVFESAPGQHNMISIFSRGKPSDTAVRTCITRRTGPIDSKIFNEIISWHDIETSYYSVKQEKLYEGENCYIRAFVDTKDRGSSIRSVIGKMRKRYLSLEHYCDVESGIQTSLDKISDKHLKKYPALSLKKNEGVFVLSEEEKKELCAPQNSHLFYKWYKNSDIDRYYTVKDKKEQEYIVYLKDEGEPIILDENLSQHFLRYQSILVDIKKNCFSNQWLRNIVEPWLERGNYFVLFYPRKANIFLGEKIVAPYRSMTNIFAYNNCEWFASVDVTFITQKDKSVDLKYVLSVLNSTLIKCWLHLEGKRKGDILELYPRPIKEIPIPQIPIKSQRPFMNVVDDILEVTADEDYLLNDDKQAIVKAYEHQIDLMVYALYELTPREITIVEQTQNSLT